ncbi:mitochondrial 54S ribosomal protein uL24m MRPL40 ASCRUDRAFT_74189 [Ascoidea rubescens DSM 1968]|uniref:KOW domain-containing protein n=1 Tax=Ascoidea rubescens DSM 1968 TaxID=1344418 RepID=A0A1D2VMB8_9ASCO|nr:hypothetical protein ASCRUDRAFT_74189 [Ascoidea rubescens DSM 1968]ODV62707.1 hypothetical protein ASCRUDRAFT_74189 [Ascoidea rubescens DSM 1968]
MSSWSRTTSRFIKDSTNLKDSYIRSQENFLKKYQLEHQRSVLPKVPEKLRFNDDFAKRKYVPGDRVVIVKGPLKGTVTKIDSFDANTNGYTLVHGPHKKIAVPKCLWVAGQKSHVTQFPEPVTQDYIKLIAIRKDPTTGLKTDVIIDDVEFRGEYFDSVYQRFLPKRYVKYNPQALIPWPELNVPEEIGEWTTSREDAKKKSFFISSIFSSGIPKAALESLRNPYSKYNTGVYTNHDIRMLTPPTIPLTETKKKYLEEREMLRAREKYEISQKTKDYISKRVSDYIKEQKEFEAKEKEKN